MMLDIDMNVMRLIGEAVWASRIDKAWDAVVIRTYGT